MGRFFEDIDRAADGGVYAEMVENRSFDFPKPMTGSQTWPTNRLRDGIFIVTHQMAENAADPKYMAVSVKAGDTVGLINEGFGEWNSGRCRPSTAAAVPEKGNGRIFAGFAFQR